MFSFVYNNYHLFQEYRVSQTTEIGLPVQFCGTRDQLIDNGCPEVNLVGSPSSIPSRVSDCDSGIRVQQLYMWLAYMPYMLSR